MGLKIEMIRNSHTFIRILVRGKWNMGPEIEMTRDRRTFIRILIVSLTLLGVDGLHSQDDLVLKDDLVLNELDARGDVKWIELRNRSPDQTVSLGEYSIEVRRLGVSGQGRRGDAAGANGLDERAAVHLGLLAGENWRSKPAVSGAAFPKRSTDRGCRARERCRSDFLSATRA